MNILSLQDKIKENIQSFFEEKYKTKEVFVNFELPEMEFGDLSSNVALTASKKVNISPVVLGAEIKSYLEGSELENIFSKIEVKGPGFLNFYFKDFVFSGETAKSKKTFLENLFSIFSKKEVHHHDKYFVETKYSGKKILIEHSSPNLFKPFTIGHLMNGFTGEFIKRVMLATKGKVKTISYPSDISIGIAKAVYEIKKAGGLKNEVFQKDFKEVVKFLGEMYVLGVSNFKKAEEEKDEKYIRDVKDVSNNLFNGISGDDLEIYKKTKDINLKYLFSNLKSLGSDFDGFVFESEAGVIGKKIVLKHLDKVFKKSEGAVVYIPDEDRKDINTTVFINSEGNPTYAAKDIGLLEIKFKKYSPDFSFFITDNEQGPHFKVVLDAAGKINKRWQMGSFFIPHGRMSFKGERMSSRLGGVPTAEEVISEVLNTVVEKSGDKISGLSEIEKKELQNEIALSALRISILKSKPGLNIDFDPERSLSFEGNSGPYLCYTHARLFSVIQKGLSLGFVLKKHEMHVAETENLERKIFQFEFILKQVIEELAPQKLINYLFELSNMVNSYYANNKIVVEGSEISNHNLYVINKVQKVLRFSLYLLGIKAPEKM